MRAEFALDYDMLTVERPQKLYLMARFAATASEGEKPRRALNLSLVLDRSGSMAGRKMDFTRQAAQFLVQHLSPIDMLSIVLYNDKVETLFPPQRVIDKEALSQQIDTIRVRGTTNLSGGWLEGVQHVRSAYAGHRLNRVILMSDGLANRGITDTAQLVALARQKHQEGISTTTMGLGNDFNEDLLMEIANAGGGAFYFIESPEVTPEIFKEELSGLLSVVGQNLTITIAPTSHVKGVRQLHAYAQQVSGAATSFQLGDIFAEEVKTLLLELSIPALGVLGEQQIATLSFEYDEIIDNRAVHRVDDVPVMVHVRPVGELPPPPDVHVTQSVLLLQAARARQDAVQSADKGDYTSASQILRLAAEAIDASPVKNDQLVEERAALLLQAENMAQGSETYGDYSRKSLSTQAYYSLQNRHEHTVMLRAREMNREQDKLRTIEELPTIGQQSQPPPSTQPGTTPTRVEWRGRSYDLAGDVIRIGRAVHNEIIIEEKGVSRFHSQIRREGADWFIEDLGSTNGTMVGGSRIAQPHRLSVGDVVYVCDEKLIFK
jgi:Ca-activated chloride channel family protein